MSLRSDHPYNNGWGMTNAPDPDTTGFVCCECGKLANWLMGWSEMRCYSCLYQPVDRITEEEK